MRLKDRHATDLYQGVGFVCTRHLSNRTSALLSTNGHAACFFLFLGLLSANQGYLLTCPSTLFKQCYLEPVA